MKRPFVAACICVLASFAAFGQTKPSFEVATIKPSQPLTQEKMLSAIQGGGKLPFGATIAGGRAEYLYLDLKTLLTYAYGVKPYQIKGPDWMSTTRFDIEAKMPSGATKDDAAKMLQSLLEERFKLAVHHAKSEEPVLALVAGRNGLKLKASTGKPTAIDDNTPLAPGEMKMDGPDGPVRVRVDVATGSSVIDMGLQGKMSWVMNAATQSMHIVFEMTTMSGLADMMSQLMTQLAGGMAGRQIVNLTGIDGNYDASVDLSLAEIMALAQSVGADLPGAPVNNGAGLPSDPGGGLSVAEAVQSMGLKLESRKATVDELIVDHMEKMPSAN